MKSVLILLPLKVDIYNGGPKKVAVVALRRGSTVYSYMNGTTVTIKDHSTFLYLIFGCL